MKKSFMEALYYREIRPFEYETKHSPEYDTAEADIEESKTYLKSRLSPEDAEHLDLTIIFLPLKMEQNAAYRDMLSQHGWKPPMPDSKHKQKKMRDTR